MSRGFSEGETVCPKSGGPFMTVKRLERAPDGALIMVCTRIADGAIREERFKASEFRSVD